MKTNKYEQDVDKSMKLQTPKGMQDYVGSDAENFNTILNAFETAFQRFGFVPIRTPIVEYANLLKGKYGEDEKLIYEFKDKAGRGLALRYDLTVPLARVVGSNQFPLPAKFYNLGRVFRYDTPQKGRKREFVQADIDIIGSNSEICDAELIASMSYGFSQLGLKPTFRINNRAVMNQIFEQLRIPKSKFANVLRTIDKLDKIGVRKIKAELGAKGIVNTAKLMRIVGVKGSLVQVRRGLKEQGINVEFAPFENLLKNLRKFQLNPTKVVLDLSLARGLDYYTGNVYEIDLGAGISVGAGGRYDSLVRNLTGKDLTGVGISVGISRLFDLIPQRINSSSKKVFVLGVGGVDISKVVSTLRFAGVCCTYDLNARNIGNALNYANKIGSDYAIIVGSKEIRANKVVLKDMKSGNESKLTLNQVILKLK
tara:strand:+ start:2764 stop:4038 length:1275 start_codon:yes stop_codon:yes gene_type:complete